MPQPKLGLATSPCRSAPRSAPSITVRRALGRVVVTVQGTLDVAGAMILERMLSDLIEGQGNLDVAVHLVAAGAGDGATLDALRVAAEQASRRRAAFSVHRGPHRTGGHRTTADRLAQTFSATSSV